MRGASDGVGEKCLNGGMGSAIKRNGLGRASTFVMSHLLSMNIIAIPAAWLSMLSEPVTDSVVENVS